MCARLPVTHVGVHHARSSGVGLPGSFEGHSHPPAGCSPHRWALWPPHACRRGARFVQQVLDLALPGMRQVAMLWSWQAPPCELVESPRVPGLRAVQPAAARGGLVYPVRCARSRRKDLQVDLAGSSHGRRRLQNPSSLHPVQRAHDGRDQGEEWPWVILLERLWIDREHPGESRQCRPRLAFCGGEGGPPPSHRLSHRARERSDETEEDHLRTVDGHVEPRHAPTHPTTTNDNRAPRAYSQHERGKDRELWSRFTGLRQAHIRRILLGDRHW
mmetsp:Transcript_8894/g.25404  ORF Transcript_8894/g.25404 Transcript_8894/m.25404 type:complete len:273 (-) Transcript_8894:1781-2599(-)